MDTYPIEKWTVGSHREVEVRLSQGQKASEVCRGFGHYRADVYRWRKELGGMKIYQARRPRELACDLAGLRKTKKEKQS